MGKLESTWKLVRQAFAVLMQEKRLLFFPVVTSLVTVFIFLFILVAYFENVINKVFQCALYIYAAEGEVPGPFDQALLDAAWKVKKKAD